MHRLVEHGADLDIQNNNELTALDIAIRNKQIDIIKFLLLKGASIESKYLPTVHPKDNPHSRVISSEVIMISVMD